MWVRSTVPSSCLGWFLPWPWVVSSLACTEGASAKYLRGSSMQLCPLWYSVLWTQTALLSQDSQLIFSSKKCSWLCLTQFLQLVLLPENSLGNTLGQLSGFLSSFLVSNRSLSFIVWCSMKLVSFILFFVVVLEGRSNLCYSIFGCSGNLLIGFYIWNLAGWFSS